MKKLIKTFKIALLLASSIFFTYCSNDSITPTTDLKTENLEVELSANRATTTYRIKRYVFNRSNGANGLGHVGVGFEVRTVNPTSVFYYFGGLENSSGAFSIPRGGDNSGWYSTSSTGSAMFAYMKANYQYNRYIFEATFKSVPYQSINNCIAKIKDFPNRGYFLAGNNCMNATYDVITSAGGLNVPAPSNNPVNYFPNNWYNSLIASTLWSGSVNL